MKKKILVTGGTGFLGYHYLAYLSKKKSFLLYSLSRKKPSSIKKLKNVKYLIGDLSNKKDLNKLSKISFNYVVNFAGNINHKEKLKTFNSHYMGVKNLINCLDKKNLFKFIQLGSSVEYGKINSPHLEKKGIPKSKRIYSTYGQSKLLSTIFLMKENKIRKLPTLVIRPYLIYGPFQSLDRLIPITINSCLQNKSFACSDGLQSRDFLFVSDAVSFIYKMMIGTEVGKIFNLGSGKKIMVRNVINKIVKLCKGGKPIFGKIKLRKDEIFDLYPSIKLAKSQNWKPKISLDKGLKLTLNYYKNNLEV